MIKISSSYYFLEKYKLAFDYGVKAIQLDSASLEALGSKVMALAALKKNDEVLDHLDKIEQMFVDNNDIIYAKGTFLSSLALYEEAIDCFLKVVENNQNHDLAWRELGIAYQMTNKFEQARECFNKAREIQMKPRALCFAKYYDIQPPPLKPKEVDAIREYERKKGEPDKRN